MVRILLTSFFFLMLITTISYSATIYVDVANTSGNEDGSQEHPFNTIQEGIDATSDGDTVLVADGTYTGDGNRDIDFDGKGITLQSVNGADNCIIDCEGTWVDQHRGFYFHSGESETSVVDGFTIQNGWVASQGGGIHCIHSSPTIVNNIISGNSAYNPTGDPHGGGIFCNNSSPTIANNTITSNSSSSDGGGISFYYNSSSMIANNTITGNSARNGGGICVKYDASPTLTNNIISGNSANGNGGGIYCVYDTSPSLTNNTITDNSASSNGGGVFCGDRSIPTIINCILWDDNPQEIYFYSTNPNGVTVSYSDVQGGEESIVHSHPDDIINWGGGNIDTDPLFGNPYSGLDYDLKPGSPCINAGTSNGAPSTDIVGRLRPSGNGVDMGAYEQNDDGSLPVTLSTFTATTSVNGIELRWRTESEVNNIGFSIYRSTSKDSNYTKIAFVDGAGNSAISIDYHYTDTDTDVEPDKIYFYYIEDIDIAGNRNKSEIIKVIVPTIKAVIPTTKIEPIPKESKLLQNYPNPFNPETYIPFQLASDVPVTISIYNAKGNLIRTLDIGNKPAGIYTTKDRAAYWDGRDRLGQKVSSGLCYYTIEAGEYRATKRMLVVK